MNKKQYAWTLLNFNYLFTHLHFNNSRPWLMCSMASETRVIPPQAANSGSSFIQLVRKLKRDPPAEIKIQSYS